MKANHSCAHCGPDLRGPQKRIGIFAALVPGSLIVFLPKCPLCVAAYVATLTGVGVSVATISHVKFVLILLCAVSMLYLLAQFYVLRRHVR